MNNIIITGSSRGIGAATAKEWCKRGEKNLYYQISRWSDFDISDFKQFEEFMKDFYNFSEEYYPIALINNAAIAVQGSILETDMNIVKKQFNINFNAIVNTTKEYTKFCINKKIKGKIINIASTAGLGARPGRAIYAATKAALINFSLSMSEELKPYGIKIYIVCPGAVNTDMRHELEPDDDFKNMLQPHEVGKFICNLIESDNFLNGQILEVKK
ncbi:SDR family NAD(P)-dependent oxidoreductase [Arcobacter sp.]|uniref:SDR family NAD(P)-dependent oxidoreductase n=1 Tax=Arcobacter sp. TaxID=1872629 RepID=UPI003D0BBA29